MHRTPCFFLNQKKRTVGCLDGLLLEQLSREGIGLTDSSTVYIALAHVQHSLYRTYSLFNKFLMNQPARSRGLPIVLKGDIAVREKF